MNAEETISLKPIQNAILHVYEEFRAVCRKNNLRYWAAAGTLLGAVRHKGFIPWDDDLDVYMPRADYNRFMQIAAKELPGHLKVVSLSNTPEYHNSFNKIMDTRADVQARVERESGVPLSQGVFVDIFPMDGLANSSLLRKLDLIQVKLVYMRISRLFRRGVHSSMKGWIGEWIGALLGLVFPHYRTERDFSLLANRLGARRPFDGSRDCGCLLGGPFGWELIVPRETLDDVMEVPFEDTVMPIPRNYDLWLRRYYGNYMQLPPVERRVPSHSKEEVAPWRYGPTGEE